MRASEDIHSRDPEHYRLVIKSTSSITCHAQSQILKNQIKSTPYTQSAWPLRALKSRSQERLLESIYSKLLNYSQLIYSNWELTMRT